MKINNTKINKWKFHLDYEKEEAWLNEMSAKGLAFTSLFLFRFTFTDCKPGEYIYRTEFLRNSLRHPESQKYISFMAENGVEFMASWSSLVYFRKKAPEGSFDIYSDLDSRLAHYRRVSTCWLAVIAFWFAFALVEMMVMFSPFHVLPLWLSEKVFSTPVGILAVMVCWGFGAVFFVPWNAARKKIRVLKKEKILRE
ncbi:MAG: DUF2812 domain-containing protein [Peptococcaceae bacterium]|nr:DUF2812 domain-containing protein [Peptococcaceae bacterium]